MTGECVIYEHRVNLIVRREKRNTREYTDSYTRFIGLYFVYQRIHFVVGGASTF